MVKKAIAIIQARMSSSRLPGKVLMNLSQKPMLWHIVERLKECKYVDKIVVATSVEKSDDLIEKLDEITQSGDMVITMGAGNIWRYCDFYVNHLKTINNGVKID